VVNTGGAGNGTSLTIWSSVITFFYQGGNFIQQSDTTISAGSWIHIAFSYDGSAKTVQIYLNGVPDGSAKSVGATTWTTGGIVRLGAWYNLTYDYLGLTDNLHVWSTNLTDSEMLEVYNLEKP